MILQAPYELIQATIFLPEPEYSNSEALSTQLIIRRSMSGKPYSYPKSDGKIKLSFSLILTREKSAELVEFVSAYSGYNWKLTDHKEKYWKVILLNEPELVNDGRSFEKINLDFEGEEL